MLPSPLWLNFSDYNVQDVQSGMSIRIAGSALTTIKTYPFSSLGLIVNPGVLWKSILKLKYIYVIRRLSLYKPEATKIVVFGVAASIAA